MEAQLRAEAAARAGARRVVVDGEVFAVWSSTVEGVRGTHFDWISGPNSGYGFSGSGVLAPGDDEGAASAIRQFLGMVDPDTGYIGD